MKTAAVKAEALALAAATLRLITRHEAEADLDRSFGEGSSLAHETALHRDVVALAAANNVDAETLYSLAADLEHDALEPTLNDVLEQAGEPASFRAFLSAVAFR